MTTTSPTAAKAALRTSARRDRRAARERIGEGPLSGDLTGHAAAIARHLLARPGTGSLLVTAFVPTASEPDVLALVARLREHLAAAGRDLRVLFPADSGTPMLDWIEAREDDEAADSPGRGFGREPSGPRHGSDVLADADLVLAPALLVARDGTRLGHGGGYYDRALAHLAPHAPVIAVVHPWELREAGALPRAAHDRAIDAILTSDGIVPVDGGKLLLGA
ncbi:5-formyltetrahydrofolate cyclo-ligase [Brachybacterium huguangmaarense]